MTIDLDTRLRGATASLRQASERLSPSAPVPRSLRPLGAAAAAVVALVVLGAGALAVGAGGDDDGSRVSTDPSGVPRLIPDELPGGLPPSGAVDLPNDQMAEGGTFSIAVFGDPDSDDPFARADLAIVVREGNELPAFPDGQPVTVRGHEGVSGHEPTLGFALAWIEGPGMQVIVCSDSLDGDQLLAIAEGLRFAGRQLDVASIPAGLPGSLDLVGRLVGQIHDVSYGVSVPLPASVPGHVVGYQSDGGGRSATVATIAGDASDLAVLRWITGANDRTEVRGHVAWTGSHGAGRSADPIFLWEESPGVLGVVQGVGLTEDQVRAMAESLRPATDAEWEAVSPP